MNPQAAHANADIDPYEAVQIDVETIRVETSRAVRQEVIV
jgi:hypothetical protein